MKSGISGAVISRTSPAITSTGSSTTANAPGSKAAAAMAEPEIREFMMSNIARHKVPRYIKFVESYPMNAAGKILKYKMREAAVEELGLQNLVKK